MRERKRERERERERERVRVREIDQEVPLIMPSPCAYSLVHKHDTVLLLVCAPKHACSPLSFSITRKHSARPHLSIASLAISSLRLSSFCCALCRTHTGGRRKIRGSGPRHMQAQAAHMQVLACCFGKAAPFLLQAIYLAQRIGCPTIDVRKSMCFLLLSEPRGDQMAQVFSPFLIQTNRCESMLLEHKAMGLGQSRSCASGRWSRLSQRCICGQESGPCSYPLPCFACVIWHHFRPVWCLGGK